jgi:NodT family efflux transporter outer membrane factor (OMF) lipoprotein
MVGPDYEEPIQPDIHKGLRQSSDESNASVKISPDTLAKWWVVLEDPILTRLIHEALEQNRTFQVARARVRQARAQLGIAIAGLLPQADASASYGKGRSSENNGMGPSVTQELYCGGFDVSWEIDIFGGTRRGAQAAEADLQAQSASLQNVWVSLAGEVAEAYIVLRSNQQQFAVAQANVEVQEKTLGLLQSRKRAGLIDDLAILQATYNLERTRSLLPALRSNIESSLSTLAVLTGKMPNETNEELLGSQGIPTPAKAVAVGIPADALRRRPDIRQAERELAAQTARIGEATADLYPRFSLLGSIGLESIDSSVFFDSGSRVWSWGPVISWPIFRGGSIRRNIEVQTAIQEQLLARYEQTVLLAVKEVQDALVSYAEGQHRRDALAAALRAACEAVTVSGDQYKNGLVDFSNVLDAQKSQLELEEQLIQTDGQILTSLVRLYKALGGGWSPLDVLHCESRGF